MSYYDLYYDDMYGGEMNDNLIFIICGFLLFICVFIFYQMNKNHADMLNKINEANNLKVKKNVKKNKNKQIDINLNREIKNEEPPASPFQLWREYDYRSLNDPLVAPKRRDDYNLPVLPFPTRGFPAPYKKVGMLIDRKANDNDRFKILLLMGRNKHPGTTVYEYYAVDNDKNSSLKFDINRRGSNELQTDDKVKVEQLDRIYTVAMDQTLGYEYDPYLY